MSSTTRSGLLAAVIVGLFAGTAGYFLAKSTARPPEQPSYPPARYYDGAVRDVQTGEPLRDDDPRLNFSKWATETQELDRRMTEDRKRQP